LARRRWLYKHVQGRDELELLVVTRSFSGLKLPSLEQRAEIHAEQLAMALDEAAAHQHVLDVARVRLS